MPTALLKSEISRVARKEVRAETRFLKNVVGTYRSEIAGLKKRVQILEQELRRVAKSPRKTTATADVVGEPSRGCDSAQGLRFAAQAPRTLRGRLWITAWRFGTFSLQVGTWSVPPTFQIPAGDCCSVLGKKEAAARLEALR